MRIIEPHEVRDVLNVKWVLVYGGRMLKRRTSERLRGNLKGFMVRAPENAEIFDWKNGVKFSKILLKSRSLVYLLSDYLLH